jgi:PAS domain-containing protein
LAVDHLYALSLEGYEEVLGMPSAEPGHLRLLDLDDLESNDAPLFLIKKGEVASNFDFLFCNEAFRKLRLRDTVLAQDKAALLFRSWVQALGDFKPRYAFHGRVWQAEITGRRGGWKLVKAIESDTEEHERTMDEQAKEEDGIGTGRTPVFMRSRTQLIGELKRDNAATFRNLPHTNLNTRWESIQTMMEMSDVGVFEYNSEGTLLHANEAWYRLRYVPLHLCRSKTRIDGI